ncbi:hypothetical protein CC78DRAFT_345588 [Lojkania enalia]|uniref:Uncharacterized protein n=1 Tax=Lojkania enalia TaxID=147567 RepID=A0A9P4K7U0_9PLEO|nr:hypothetical protein CC78DRAFT_345588 [Didymosphaeria enalia]
MQMPPLLVLALLVLALLVLVLLLPLPLPRTAAHKTKKKKQVQPESGASSREEGGASAGCAHVSSKTLVRLARAGSGQGIGEAPPSQYGRPLAIGPRRFVAPSSSQPHPNAPPSQAPVHSQGPPRPEAALEAAGCGGGRWPSIAQLYAVSTPARRKHPPTAPRDVRIDGLQLMARPQPAEAALELCAGGAHSQLLRAEAAVYCLSGPNYFLRANAKHNRTRRTPLTLASHAISSASRPLSFLDQPHGLSLLTFSACWHELR